MGTRIRMSIACIGLILFGTITYANVSQESVTFEETLVNIKDGQEYSQEVRTTEQAVKSDFNEPKERTTSSVISVDIPTHINMIIDPYETMNNGAIISDEIKIINYSNIPIDVNLASFQVDIPEKSEVLYTGLPIPQDQSKNMGLYLWNEESRKRIDLYEGSELMTLDTLGVGQVSTYMLKGEVNSININWNEEDRVNAEFIFTIGESQ